MANDSLGDRMKAYESVPRARLMPKTPVLLRLDGKAFHTLTRGMDRPYDERFMRCMWSTATELCDSIQGCKIAYVQSDEITLLLIDYQTYQTQGWFDYEVQKMCSISASIATAAFGDKFRELFPERKATPLFDARCWNLPREEVANCLIWRQQDASRNSIQMLAQAHFSHKEMHLKNCSMLQDMLMLDKGVNWNDQPVPFKRGACAIRESYAGPENSIRHRWVIDENVPIFTQNRDYVERCLAVEI